MKIFRGKVISNKMKDTAIVAVKRIVKHSVYGKRIRKTRKYHVHDPFGVKLDQIVNFVASKPFSKTIKWTIITDEKKTKNKTKGGKS